MTSVYNGMLLKIFLNKLSFLSSIAFLKFLKFFKTKFNHHFPKHGVFYLRVSIHGD